MIKPGDIITWSGYAKETHKPICVVLDLSEYDCAWAWVRLGAIDKKWHYRNSPSNVRPIKLMGIKNEWVVATPEMFEDGIYAKAIEIL